MPTVIRCKCILRVNGKCKFLLEIELSTYRMPKALLFHEQAYRLNCRNARRTNENEKETLFLFCSCFCRVLPKYHISHIYLFYLFICVSNFWCVLTYSYTTDLHRQNIEFQLPSKTEKREKENGSGHKMNIGPVHVFLDHSRPFIFIIRFQ